MSYALDNLRLLIAHDSQDEAEQLMNALRNAGRATRAHLALGEEDLLRALKGGSWELMLCRPQFGDGTFEKAMAHLNRLGKAIPVILLEDDFSSATVKKGMQQGARAVAPAGDRELISMMVDRLTEYLRLRKELQHSEIVRHDAEKRLSLLMDQSRDAIAYVLDGMHIHANDNYVEMFGYESADDLAGVPIMDMVSASDHDKLKQLLRSRAQDENQTQELECKGVNTDGSEFDATFTFSPSTYDGEACTQIVIRAAGVDQSEIEARIREISDKDQVTGLFSRNWFMNQLDDAVAAAARESQLSAVLYLRLDDFEHHQSALGLDGADELLRAVADWLTSKAGKASLARVDGEDFALMLPVEDTEAAGVLADKLRKGIEGLMPEVSARTVQVTASVGVAFIREDARNSQDSLTTALKCCNQAQRGNDGKGNSIKVHDPMDDVAAGSSEAIAMQVRQALEQGSFKLHYQPLMNLEDESDHLFEVFVSLPQKEGDVLEAKDFIPVAAEEGMGGKIDRWVVLNGMRAAAALGQPVKMLFNINGSSLVDQGLADWMLKAMKAAKMEGRNVIFQFSEGDATTYLKQAALFAQKVQAAGCKVSISRFGGGLDPFKLFHHISANMVKFEGSFTQDLAKPEGRDRLAEIIKEVSEGGRQTVVGFVESAAQMQALWSLGGVNYLQGFYLQAPMESLQIPETA
ncbi:MAG: EAL domain-containing protein [Alcanivorax sediminis]|uniref:EAL domain-containing protein n=1 Tax=Alcanivorax sediminis TaxID=2663008 RepID=A0A6N7LUE1_9GAMM|nr:EAL domain-containing protein [Alcanivorax sediminis]MQX51710.1 EAL domain-containing protein [Alcanivorax sediminis]